MYHLPEMLTELETWKSQLFTHDGLKWNCSKVGIALLLYMHDRSILHQPFMIETFFVFFFIRASDKLLESAALTIILSRHQVYPSVFNSPLLPTTYSDFMYIDSAKYIYIRLTSEKKFSSQNTLTINHLFWLNFKILESYNLSVRFRSCSYRNFLVKC